VESRTLEVESLKEEAIVTDENRQTHKDSIYRASIMSRGKTWQKVTKFRVKDTRFVDLKPVALGVICA